MNFLFSLCSIFFLNFIRCVYFDPLGYITYCPCMGRFGNQADHFLGALGFAKALNRTLVLPAWIEYRQGERKSIQVPFDTYFQVNPLKKYHKVITMERFMKEIAPYEWPPDRRISFCYMSRGNTDSCNAKEGNPFGPFWDTYGVNFIGSEFYGPLNYDVNNANVVEKWKVNYPASEWPVLAFTGSPATFPVSLENRKLHKYLIWSEAIESQAKKFVESELPKGAFVGIHLRNGMDWVRACQHIPESPNLFAAPQCLGYRNENGNATSEMCLPSRQSIMRQLKRLIKSVNSSANKNNDKTVKAVFVASDNHHMIEELRDSLKRMDVTVVKLPTSNPHLDLAILGKANYFIGNCISSFSAFVKRERDCKGFPSTFWAFPPDKSNVRKTIKHDEF